jgi:hypothetical protein
MSVGTRRLAAAQRTAAWITIGAALSLFPAGASASGGVAGTSVELKGSGAVVCRISGGQLKRVSAAYATTVSNVTVDGRGISLVSVYGADEQSLRTLLRARPEQCRLIHVSHWFFLPLDTG